MPSEMLYLLRVDENPNFDQTAEDISGRLVGLFKISDKGAITPVLHPDYSALGFSEVSDLGRAIAAYFRREDESIDALTLTERIEATDIPLQLPYVVWTDPPTVYDMFDLQQYMKTIQTITEELAS